MTKPIFKACRYLIQDTTLGARDVSGFAVGGTPYRIGVHRNSDGWWVVDDWFTGMRVECGKTRAEAVRNAIEHLDKRGLAAIAKAHKKIAKAGLFRTTYHFGLRKVSA